MPYSYQLASPLQETPGQKGPGQSFCLRDRSSPSQDRSAQHYRDRSPAQSDASETVAGIYVLRRPESERWNRYVEKPPLPGSSQVRRAIPAVCCKARQEGQACQRHAHTPRTGRKSQRGQKQSPAKPRVRRQRALSSALGCLFVSTQGPKGSHPLTKWHFLHCPKNRAEPLNEKARASGGSDY